MKTDCGFLSSPTDSAQDLLIQYGPTLLVRIGFDPEFQPARGVHPQLPAREWPALIDTGAIESCIDSALASALKLPIVDRKKISGAHGEGELNFHLAQIHIPSLPYTIYGQFAGVHLAMGGQPHNALIGRTFLQNFTMIYEGETGKVVLSCGDP